MEQKKVYSIATLSDPRFKLAGFQSRENAQLAKQLAFAEISFQDQDSEPDTVVVATNNANPPATKPTDTWGDALMDSGEEDNGISQDEEESI